MTITPNEARRLHVWEELCELLGMNPWALNWGSMAADKPVELTMEQARSLGLLDREVVEPDHDHPDERCRYIGWGLWDCGVTDSTG